MRLVADPGTQQWVPWAERKLEVLTRLRRDLGLPSLKKTYVPATGVSIWLLSADGADFVRITGGTWASADPVVDIWDRDEAVFPAIQASWSPLATAHQVRHRTRTYLERPRVAADGTTQVTQEQSIVHTLLIGRYCKVVASVSWTETWTYNDQVAGYDKVGQYAGFNDSVVNLRDTSAAGAVTNRTMPHTLGADALANPWGWGPPVPPSLSPWYVDSSASTRVTSGSGWSTVVSCFNSYKATNGSASNPPVTSTGTISNVHSGYFVNGREYATMRVAGEATTSNPPHMINAGDIVPHDPNATYDVFYHTDPAYLVAQAQADAANANGLATYLAARQTYLDTVCALVQSVAVTLANLTATDATQLAPHPLVPYRDQQAAYVFPPSTTVTLRASWSSDDGTGHSTTLTRDFQVVGDRAPLVLNNTYWGVTFALVSSYATTIQPPSRFDFTPATRTFAYVPSAAAPWYQMKKAYFSSEIDLTQLQCRSASAHAGLYRVAASAAAQALFAAGLGVGDDPSTTPPGVDPAARMQTMTAGTPDFDTVTYAVYSGLFTTRGAHYRQSQHTYGAQVQAAIPNTDYP
jgi:hypothetical protein